MSSEPVDGGNVEYAIDSDKGWRHCSEINRETAWEEKFTCPKCTREVAWSRTSGNFSHLVRTKCAGAVPAIPAYSTPASQAKVAAPVDLSWLSDLLKVGAAVVTGVVVVKFCNTPMIRNPRAAWWKPWEPRLLSPTQACQRWSFAIR